jgi:hypothetical protein
MKPPHPRDKQSLSSRLGRDPSTALRLCFWTRNSTALDWILDLTRNLRVPRPVAKVGTEELGLGSWNQSHMHEDTVGSTTQDSDKTNQDTRGESRLRSTRMPWYSVVFGFNIYEKAAIPPCSALLITSTT